MQLKSAGKPERTQAFAENPAMRGERCGSARSPFDYFVTKLCNQKCDRLYSFGSEACVIVTIKAPLAAVGAYGARYQMHQATRRNLNAEAQKLVPNRTYSRRRGRVF